MHSEASINQEDPVSVESALEEDIFLGGIGRLIQRILNIILTLFKPPWRRKKWFLVNGSVKWRPPIPNIILAFEDNMEGKEMISGGWNRQREASNNHQDSGSVEGSNTKP